MPSDIPSMAPSRLTGGELAVLGTALVTGLASRIGWSVIRHANGTDGEAHNVAVALATDRGFADSFVAGQGSTAHLMPVHPAIVSLAYRAFGVTQPAEFVLSSWALLVVFATFGLFCLAARRSGLSRGACIGGLAFLLAVPIYTTVEAIDFRVWEGGFALCLAGLIFLLLLGSEGRPVGRRRIIALAALAALLFFTHPSVGLAVYLMLALFAWRNLDRRRIVEAALAAAVALAVLVVPWTIRNERMMGAAIPLRDNLGMELAMANYPAIDPADPDAERIARLIAIQPFLHPAAFAKLRAAGGEVAYSRMLGRETLRWIVANPRASAQLLLRHVHEMVFPRPWMFATAHNLWMTYVRSALVSLVALFGLAGLWLRRDHLATAYWAILIGALIVGYLPFQPIARYTWLLYPPLAYFAAELVATIRGRSPTGR